MEEDDGLSEEELLKAGQRTLTLERAFRVLRRRLEYRGSATRPDLPENCPERLNWEFAAWIWNTRRTGREMMQRHIDDAPTEKAVFCLRTPQDVDKFV